MELDETRAQPTADGNASAEQGAAGDGLACPTLQAKIAEFCEMAQSRSIDISDVDFN